MGQLYNFEEKSIYLRKKSIICMLVYFQCLTHTAVYATANLYVCAPNTRGGPKLYDTITKKKNNIIFQD